LGFVWPAVGYLYAGRGLHGLLLLAFLPIAQLGILLLAVLLPVAVLCVVIPAVLSLALHVGLAWGAAHAASTFPADRARPVFSRWYSCLAAVVLAAGASIFWTHGYRTTFAQAFRIPTGGMEPTLLNGDRLIVAKWTHGWRDPVFGQLVSKPRKPTRGELLVFRFPEDRSRAFIKRCIGLPGETVEVRGRTVLIDGKPLDEPYVQFLERPSMASVKPDFLLEDPLGDWGPQSVPQGMYFVLGDNRDNSRDSRFWGFVPQEDLLGRAAVITWSYETPREELLRAESEDEWSLPSIARVRWERFGRRLK
jgi:signal peptidase I